MRRRSCPAVKECLPFMATVRMISTQTYIPHSCVRRSSFPPFAFLNPWAGNIGCQLRLAEANVNQEKKKEKSINRTVNAASDIRSGQPAENARIWFANSCKAPTALLQIDLYVVSRFRTSSLYFSHSGGREPRLDAGTRRAQSVGVGENRS